MATIKKLFYSVPGMIQMGNSVVVVVGCPLKNKNINRNNLIHSLKLIQLMTHIAEFFWINYFYLPDI